MGVRGAPLDLRAFLLRGHSLRLYRAALRSARRAPAYSREDLERTIREEFEQHRFEGKPQTIRFLLSDGVQRLKQLNTMLGIQGHEDGVKVISGRSAVHSFSPWMQSARFCLSEPLKMSSHKRRGNVIASASDESTKKDVPSWRKELTSLEDPAGENSDFKDDFLQNSSMEEDIARLQKKRDLEKRIENFNRTGNASMGEKTDGEGMVRTVVEKVLVADFFFILFILAWLVAGLGERSFLQSTTLIDAWLPLWTTVFQPALGVFMAGAIVSAVSGFLFKSGNK